MNGLAKLDQATRMLAEIRTIDDAAKVINLAEAARIYAKQVDLGLEAQNGAAEIKLRAQRRAGDILKQMRDADELRGPGGDPLLQAAKMGLADLDIEPTSAHRWEAVRSIPEERFEQVIADTKALGGELTTTLMLKAKGNVAPVSIFTGNQENYTPNHILELVREVLGVIDLDPASCDFANKTIRAKKFFDINDDGLSKKWHGNVFLNPPYQMPEIREFTDKLLAELPNIQSAILLTNNNTDTIWFHNCALKANLICFTRGRISFYIDTGTRTQPTNGQAFFYFGDNSEKFKEVFSKIGLIMVKI